MNIIGIILVLFPFILFSHESEAQTPLTSRSFYATTSNSIVYLEIEGATETGEPKNAIGSGFIISKSGYIITSYHLFTDEKRKPLDTFVIKGVIGTNNGYGLSIDRISIDPDNDLALLKFSGSSDNYSPVALCNTSAYPSQSVGALGFGLGFELQLVLGSVSSAGGRHGRWQINLSVSQGFSGGPVFDENGRVIAVTTEGVPGVAGANFATPISFASNMTDTVPGGVSLICSDGQTLSQASVQNGGVLNPEWKNQLEYIPPIENVGCSCVHGVFPPRDPTLSPRPPGTAVRIINNCPDPVGVLMQRENFPPPYAPQFLPAPGRQFIFEGLQAGQELRADVSYSRIGAVWVTSCPNQSKIYQPPFGQQ